MGKKRFLKYFYYFLIGILQKSNNNVKSKLLPLFDNMGKIVIFLGTVYFVMISWGINPVGWLRAVGVLGVVLGGKDTLANLFLEYLL